MWKTIFFDHFPKVSPIGSSISKLVYMPGLPLGKLSISVTKINQKNTSLVVVNLKELLLGKNCLCDNSGGKNIDQKLNHVQISTLYKSFHMFSWVFMGFSWLFHMFPVDFLGRTLMNISWPSQESTCARMLPILADGKTRFAQTLQNV